MPLINSGKSTGTDWSKYLPVGFDGAIVPASGGVWKAICSIQGSGFLHSAVLYGAPTGSSFIYFRVTVDDTVMLYSSHNEATSFTTPQVSALTQEAALTGGTDGASMSIRVGTFARSVNRSSNVVLALPGSPAAIAGSPAIMSIFNGVGYPFQHSLLVEIKTTNTTTYPASVLVQTSVEQ